MNTKRCAIAVVSMSVLAISASAPAQAQFLKKLLQGSSQQNEFQNNQFGQPYNGFGNSSFNTGGFNTGGFNTGGFNNGFSNTGMPFNGGFNGGFQNRGSSNLSSSLNSLDSSADQVSKSMQKFLQASGRWMPQPTGNDMQACVAMQNFKQLVGQVKRNAGGNITPQFQMQLSQLQQSANNLVNAMAAANIDPGTQGQAQMLRDNVSQMMAMSSITPGGNPMNPFWNMGGQNYPGFNNGMLHINQGGRGALTVMGQQYMRFRDVSVETIDPVSRRVRVALSGGRDNLILSGPITQQTMNAVTIAVDSSDKGAINGVLNIGFGSNGSVGSINSSGQMNGQGYAIQFSGQ